MTNFRALVVDDDRNFRESLSLLVGLEGYDVRQAADLAAARRALAEAPADVVLVDLNLPDGDGIELLDGDSANGKAEFVVITGNATVDSAVQALRNGATDYLTKPLDRARLKSLLASVARMRAIKIELNHLRGELRQLGRFGPLVGRSPVMQEVYDLITRVAPTQAGVLLTGESGTGKELAAETIHALSRRRDRTFLGVNCGAVAKTLIESELFGHEKGSFTGASGARRGYFEEANGGTLFLDEVTEMPAELQAKLLRVLETSTVLRVGASDAIPVDVRVIAATNRDPARAVKDGILREDLYYRLNVFPIRLPPLRERREDIELLACHFLDVVNLREGTQKHFSDAARMAIHANPWPGNVRELKNAVERAAILADATIEADLFPGSGSGAPIAGDEQTLQVRVGSALEDVERRLILATLASLGGDKRRAAEVLGVSLKTLYNRLNVYQAAGESTEIH